MKNFIYYWLPVFVWAGVIFYFSSLARIPPIIMELIPKTYICHIIVYAILSILLLRASINSKNTTFRENAIYLTILIAILYGITDEIHQQFVPGRVFSHLDVIANSVGSVVILTKNFFVRGKLYLKRQLKTRSLPE